MTDRASAPDKPRDSIGSLGSMDARVAWRVIAAAADIALVIRNDDIIEEVAIGESVTALSGSGGWVGKRWAETVAVDSQIKVEQLLRDARAGVTTRSREINQRADESSSLPFRFSAVLLGDSDRVLVLGRDLRAVASLQQQLISTQQAMHREYARLRQAETRYRLLFQISAEGVVVADTHTLKLVESNPAAAALFDDTAQGLQGRGLDTLFEPASWPAVRTLVGAVQAGGRPGEIDARLSSHAREVKVSASVFRQTGAELMLLRLVPGAGEATPHGERASRVMQVIEAMPDAFVVIGEDRRILTANAAFIDLVQQANENQVTGQPLERWFGRAGVDLNILVANLRQHGVVRNFATVIRGEYGATQEAMVSAVSALHAKVASLGLVIRTVSARLTLNPTAGLPLPRSEDQLRDLVGRVSLKEIVRETTDLIERLCIEAALKVSGDNRASAAQLLGLSRQGLYSKLRRHGMGDLDPTEPS